MRGMSGVKPRRADIADSKYESAEGDYERDGPTVSVETLDADA